ncbi:hypothetical protein LCGC14_0929190 [marine sediment metagenome]|uniref:HK97 gp10 family phage protein n=1 Tax=marine sediment metagenome TaxID=412755 RepID=A0A0F9NT29_9ZZZZ
MSKISFKISGAPAIKGKLKLMEVGFPNAVERAMTQSLFLAETTAKQRVPVITGRLRRSIRGGITSIGRGFVEGTLGANTVYAAAVEFGKPGTKAKGTPYLRTAILENKSKIQKLISDALKKTLRGFKT